MSSSPSPMETEQNPTTDQNGAVPSQHSPLPPPPPPPLPPEDKVLVPGTTLSHFLSSSTLQYSNFSTNFRLISLIIVEVCLKPSSTASIHDVRSAVEG